MKLEDLGYNDKLQKLRVENNLSDFEIGRVIAEHKERYIVKTIYDYKTSSWSIWRDTNNSNKY
jgi:hypothetical protein